MIETAGHPIPRVLYVSYPLLTVSEESAGGAEQMLCTLEREMARRGVCTTVAASVGSQVSGELFFTGQPCTTPDDFERRNREHQSAIMELIQSRARPGKAFDLIHDESGSFWPRAAEIDVPMLATLHLPWSFYPRQFFENIPENVSFNCVSESQARSFGAILGFRHARDTGAESPISLASERRPERPALPRFGIRQPRNCGSDINSAVVPNGICLERFTANLGPRCGLLWLGRICEEKAPHLALEIARQTDEHLTLAGQVYPFSYHQEYFEREIRPRLAEMSNAAFIASPSPEHKRRLLKETKAVLITSLAEETSSLVAMEAAASGAPVIAFRRGALPEIVKDGVTGFLVDDVEEAIEALKHIGQIAPFDCSKYARENFSSEAMADGYEKLYSHIQSTFLLSS